VFDVRVLQTVFLWGGVAISIVGALCVGFQQTLGGLLAYSLLFGWGSVLITMGLNTPLANSAIVAFVALIFAIVSLAMGADIQRSCSRGDRLDQLFGAIRRMPLAVTATLLGAFSLSGVPPLLGFGTVATAFRGLEQRYPGWGLIVAIGMVGPLSAWVRYMIVVFRRQPVPGSKSEPRVLSVLALLSALPLIVLSLCPSLLGRLVGGS